MSLDLALAADDDLARLDERLATSAEGWIARTHFADACASSWLDGDLVAIEDLVLHDALADIRPPTPELFFARTALDARRRILDAPPGWAMSRAGCNALLGHGESVDAAPDGPAYEQPLDPEFAAIDALLARSRRTLSRHAAGAAAGIFASEQSDRFDQWRAQITATENLSPVHAAATTLAAWQDLRPIDNADWLGRLLAADLLRVRRKTRTHLCTLNIGLKSVAQSERRSRDPGVRFQALLKGFALAAEQGLRDHERWRTARAVLERKTLNRRVNSHARPLIDLVMARPLVTAALIATELKISERSARDLVSGLEIREMTGRRRYRAWGVL